jgi:hypothetical protein
MPSPAAAISGVTPIALGVMSLGSTLSTPTLPLSHGLTVGASAASNRLEETSAEAPFHFMARLLECGRNRREDRGQLRAETLHDADDGNRDAGGDESILDGGRSGFVLTK